MFRQVFRRLSKPKTAPKPRPVPTDEQLAEALKLKRVVIVQEGAE